MANSDNNSDGNLAAAADQQQIERQLQSMFSNAQSGGGSIFSRDDMQDILNASETAMQTGEVKDTPGMVVDPETGEAKFLGVVPLPREVASVFSLIYGVGAPKLMSYAQEHGYGFIHSNLDRVGVKGHSKNIVSQVGAMAIPGAMIFGPSLAAIQRTVRDHRAELKSMADEAAPILDGVKGRHNVGAVTSIKPEENEVLWAEHQRSSKKMKRDLVGNASLLAAHIPMMVSVAITSRQMQQKHFADHPEANMEPTRARSHTDQLVEHAQEEFPHVKAEQVTPGHESFDKDLYDTVNDSFQSAKKPAQALPDESQKASQEKWKDALDTFISPISLVLGSGVINSMNRKQENKIQPVSAYDMIVTLRKQLEDDPSQDRFRLPEGAHSADSTSSMSLDNYISEIFKQHQRDMGRDEIGKRNGEKLHLVTDKIAEALQQGRISGLALISLVGEGKIVTRKGKAITDEETLEKELEALSKRLPSHSVVDEKEYYAESSFSRADLEEALQNMEGEERMFFAALFPNNVLESAGMSADEVKQIRAHVQVQLEDYLHEAVAGLARLSDEQLKELGVTSAETSELRRAADAVSSEDLDTFQQTRARPGQIEGIEHTLANALVHEAVHKGKLSDMLQSKQEAIQSAQNKAADDVAEDVAQSDAKDVAEDDAKDAAQGADTEKSDEAVDAPDAATISHAQKLAERRNAELGHERS